MNSFVKTMLACLVAVLIAGSLFVSVLFSLIGSLASMGSADEGLKENSVLVLEFGGIFDERADDNPLVSLMNDGKNS